MTLLAIGATGFIGPHVVRQLIQQNHDVTVFHRGETTADLPDAVRSIHGNRNTLAKHRATFERLAPDVVIDLVAISSSDVYRNYDGWRGVSRPRSGSGAAWRERPAPRHALSVPRP